jgi:hypothetical protein
MLCIGSGFGGPELDLPAALRITESFGVPPMLALTLLGSFRQGWHEGLASRVPIEPGSMGARWRSAHD